MAPDEGGTCSRGIFGLRPNDAPDDNPQLSTLADSHVLYDLATTHPVGDVGVADDIDGGARPAGAGFDIGSDEFGASLAKAFSRSLSPRASGRRVGGGS